MSLDSSHQKREFSATVVGIADDSVLEKLGAAVSWLSVLRTWTLGPPQILQCAAGSPDEEESYGLVLDIYSALPPWDERLPFAIDLAHYNEISLVIDVLSTLSGQSSYELQCYLDDVYVGSIGEGIADRLIQEGLLGEWRRHLDKGNGEHV